MTRPGSSSQDAAPASRRPPTSSGTIPPPPSRQAIHASLQPTNRLRTRSRTGSLPPRSRERNAQHLPEVPMYPNPDEEEAEEPPRLTATANANEAEDDNEVPEPPPPLDQGAMENTCRAFQEPLRQRVESLERRQERQNPPLPAEPPANPSAAEEDAGRHQAQGEVGSSGEEARIRSLLARIAVLEADANPRRTDNDEDLQRRVMEDLRVLRQDVNTILEDRSQINRRQEDDLQQEAAPPLPRVDVNPDVNLGPVLHVDKPNMENPTRRVSTVDQAVESPERSREARSSRRMAQSRESRGSSRRNSHRTASRVKHDDSTDTESSDSLDDVPDTSGFALNIHQRQKGRKHPGLDSLVPSDERFDRLLSYRYYRLINTTALRTNDMTTRLHKTLKNLELTMREHKFSGEDPILVFDFLSRVIEEADTLGMNEGQLVTCLPHLITRRAAQSYRAIASRGRGGGLTKWPEAVQYFLRTYGTDRAIQEAIETLEGLRQSTNEDEDSFAARIGVAAYRCGNVHMESEKIGFFINGLQAAIRSIVSRFRRDQPRSVLTYDRVVAFARDEGDAYRARTRNNRSTTPPPTVRPGVGKVKPGSKSNRLVTFAEELMADLETPTESQQQDLLLVEQTDPLTSVPTDDLPSESPDEDEAVLALEKAMNAFRQNRASRSGDKVRPVPVPFDDRSRPGWKTGSGSKPICYKCYEEGHYSNDCRTSIADFEKIVTGFQKLSADERIRVPSKNYKLACRLVDPGMIDQTIANSVKDETPSKN